MNKTMLAFTLSIIIAAGVVAIVKHRRKKSEPDILNSETQMADHIRIQSTVDLNNKLKG